MLEILPFFLDRNIEWSHFITKTDTHVQGESKRSSQMWTAGSETFLLQKTSAYGRPYCPCALSIDAETDSAKLSSVMVELGFEFRPRLKR